MYASQEPVTQVTPGTTLDGEVVRPVAVGPTFAAPVVQPVETARTATSTRRRFAFDSVVVGVVGLASMIVGLLAVTRAGVHGPMNQPVVRVLGFTHTETLGLIEIGVGLLLLISAAAMSRAAAIFFGLVLGVGGVVGALQTSSFKHSLALQSGLAWIAVVAAGVVVLASFALPRMSTERTTIESV